MEIFLFLCFLLLVYGFFAAQNKQKINDRSGNTGHRNSGRNNSRSHASGSPVLTFKVTVNEGDQRVRKQDKNYSNDPDKFWVTRHQTKTIKGHEITDGLIYIGTNLASVADGYWNGIEPALINPQLPVDNQKPDYSSNSMGYWPSYSTISPSARAAYLEWLATNRDNPETPIGYVFLYFYGLERRLLNDTKTSVKAQNEKPFLIEEVQRLISIYGDNHSFRRYATGLLEFVEIRKGDKNILEQAVAKEDLDYLSYTNGYDYSGLNFKKGLAYFALNEKPLPAEWALKWGCQYIRDQSGLRTPASRCKEEIAELYKLKYEKKFGKGYKLKPNRSYIELTYNTASRTFWYSAFNEQTEIPDLTKLSKPAKEFAKLFDDCTDKLDSYSRYLGRNPDDTNSVEALSNLPHELLRNHLNPSLKHFIGRVKEKLEGEKYVLLKTENFTDFWNIKGVNTYRKRESIEIAQFLFKLGIGIEPDLRFGGSKFERDSQVVVFNLDPTSYPKTPSKEYKIALLILHLTTVVGLADGSFSPEEEKYLDNYIENLFRLTGEEKNRLNAYLFWLKTENPGVRGIKRKIDSLGKEKRVSILQFLIKVANADGYIDPGEVEALQKIAEIFELDPDQIYQDIHAQQTGSEDPVLIMKGEHSDGYPIPKNQEKKSTDLDHKLINKTLKQTDEVQSILKEIFSGEEEIEPESETPAKSDHPPKESVIDLDGMHSSLLLELLAKEECSRVEYEEICANLGLLPNGALELINEKSYEHFDDVLLFDAEIIEINSELAKKITL